MSDPFLGTIQPFGFNFAPRGWAKCDGQLLPIAQYQALFSLLGTTYGGDGRTTFGLPDLRGRSMLNQGSGAGLSPRTIGQRGGSETNTLTVNQMPSHNHALQSESQPADVPDSGGNLLAQTPGNSIYKAPVPRQNLAMANEAISNTGGGQAVNNLSPYLVVNVCIALQGIFPSRN